MVQRNTIKMKSKLIKKRIVILIVIIAAIAFFVLVPKATIIFSGFLTALFAMFFPIITLLPISNVLLLTFVGFGAIIAWGFYKQDLKPVLFPGLLLVLPVLAAAVLMIFYPSLEWYFAFPLFMPFSAIMLSIFVGLGAIIVSPSYRQDLRKVVQLSIFTFGAIVVSIFFLLALLLLWALALHFIPYGTELVMVLVIAYLYWPGKKRGLFLEILGPVLALELILLLTIGPILNMIV